MKKTIIIVIVLIALLAGAYFGYGALSEKANETTAMPTQSASESISATQSAESNLPKAPDFSFSDGDGNEHKLSDFSGKPIVLNFWNSWCGPCRSEMPDFQSLYEKYGNEIQFIMLNLTDGMKETQKSAEDFIADAGYTFPVYFDLNSEGGLAYNIYSIPQTVIISSDGYIVDSAYGPIDASKVDSTLSQLSRESLI